jgi:hypothetical protein
MVAFELPIREATALPIRARVRKQWARLVEIPQPHSILRTDTACTNAFHTSPSLEGDVIQPRQSISYQDPQAQVLYWSLRYVGQWRIWSYLWSSYRDAMSFKWPQSCGRGKIYRTPQ